MKKGARGKKSILVLAGPTGGHLFPAWAFAEQLKARQPSWNITLLTGQRASRLGPVFETSPFDHVLYVRDFHSPFRSLSRLFSALGNAAGAFFQVLGWVLREKPDLAVGFGSYVSVPGCVVCFGRKIPVLLHEQNQVAGKATQFLMRFTPYLASSFDSTLPVPLNGNSWSVTGLPIRQKLLAEARKLKRHFQKPRLTWLVVGGSQGARRINDTVVKTLKLLSPEEIEKIAVIHITGHDDFERIKKDYEALKFPTQVYPFFDKMHELYPQIDFALTRAGANTLFELALFGVPAAVVPYPHAGAHQLGNARAFEQAGAVALQKESALSSDLLLRMVKIFLTDEDLRERLSKNISALARPEAGSFLAEKACALLEAL